MTRTWGGDPNSPEERARIHENRKRCASWRFTKEELRIIQNYNLTQRRLNQENTIVGIDNTSEATVAGGDLALDLEKEIVISGLNGASFDAGITHCASLDQLLADTISATGRQKLDVENAISRLNEITGFLAESMVVALDRGWDLTQSKIGAALDKTETIDAQLAQTLVQLSELHQGASISRSVIERLHEGMICGKRLSEMLQRQLSATRHAVEELVEMIDSTREG